MSSIVSRRPPASGSTSQSKDRRWMSIRFGTSRDLFRRAKERRARGAATLGKTATPQGVERRTGQQGGGALRGKSAPIQDSTRQGSPRRGAFGAHGPRPQRPRMWRGAGVWAASTIGRPRKGSASGQVAPPGRYSGRREHGRERPARHRPSSAPTTSTAVLRALIALVALGL